MSRSFQTILICGVACWLTAGTAQAGFVSPDFLNDLPAASVPAPGAGADSRPAQDVPSPKKQVDRPAPSAVADLGQRTTAPGTGGSMASGSSVSSTTPPA